MKIFNHLFFIIDSHCFLYFALYCLRKCYKKSSYKYLVLFKLCSLDVVTNTLKISLAYHNKSLFLVDITAWCKSACYHEECASSRIHLNGFTISDFFLSSIQHDRKLGRQGKVHDKDWISLGTRLPHIPLATTPIRGPKLTAREAGKCSLPVCPNWNWVNIQPNLQMFLYRLVALFQRLYFSTAISKLQNFYITCVYITLRKRP